MVKLVQRFSFENVKIINNLVKYIHKSLTLQNNLLP